MSVRPRLPALARWAAAAVVVPAMVVLTTVSVFVFGSRCPSGGATASADPGSVQGRLCGQATGETNPGDVIITGVTLLVGAFLVVLLLRAGRWLSLLLIGALCLATPVVTLAVVLATPTDCAVAGQPVGGDCSRSAED